MAALFFGLLLQLFPNGLAPVVPGGKLVSSRACEACHEAEHAEWRTSRHALAFTNAIFQREYSAHPDDWCVHCHAPLAAQLDEVHRGGGALSAEGVNCIACHVRGGRILAARARPGSPHDSELHAEFGGPAYCAGCHQFNFPRLDEDAPDPRNRVLGYTSHPMQNTVAEHDAGPHASEPCRSCHASSGEHAYAGGHDPSMLVRALSMDVCKKRGEAIVHVVNRGAGHRVPTGDVHRHLALRVWRASAPERLRELILLRRFEPVPDGGKALVEDTSLAPLESRAFRVRSVELGGSASEPLSIELRFIYTIDEFPLRELGEPSFTTVAVKRVPWSALPACAP